MEQPTSLFTLVGIGTVVEDKPEDEVTIKVFLNEVTPDMTGEISSTEISTFYNRDEDNKINKTTVTKAGYVYAKWLPLHNTNRLSAPDVIKDEKVLVYKYAGDDRYFWCTMSSNLRKKEKVLWSFSNKNSAMEPAEDGSYYMLLDTINKEINFHTSNNDGELTTYDFHMDTQDGIWCLMDGCGNYQHTASSPGVYSYNALDTIQYNTANYIINTADTLTIHTKDQVNNTGTITINNQGMVTINTGTFDIVFANGETLSGFIHDICQGCIEWVGTGNINIPVPATEETKNYFKNIQQRYAGIKGSPSSNNGKPYKEP